LKIGKTKLNFKVLKGLFKVLEREMSLKKLNVCLNVEKLSEF
jgi:hypothetical protein